jgi:error-prone DNA polymerase
VRLGLRLVKGLRQDHAERLTAAREKHGPFASIAQLHRLTGLPRHALRRLAEADAFGSLGLARRQALWQVLSLSDEESPLFDSAAWRLAEAVPSCLPKMPLRQEVMTDYRTAGLSLKTHPVALVRSTLAEGSIITSAQLQDTPHGRWARVAGLVLIRQRPGTASGIVFITIEDETGIVNLIVRPNIYEKYRRAARHAGLLEAHGYVERQGSVIHVMAWRLYDRGELLAGCDFASRDFH